MCSMQGCAQEVQRCPSKEVLSSGFQLIITQVPLMQLSEERATLALSSRAVMDADRAEWVETCGV